jgi:hypothetical protein
MVWSEAQIVKQRDAAKAKLDAVILQTAILSVLSKKGGNAFKEVVENLDDG